MKRADRVEGYLELAKSGAQAGVLFSLEMGALLAFTLFVTACEQRRMPDCLVFPQGFVGWVSIEYNVTEAAPLPVKDGCVWTDFRNHQTIRTNSKILIGWAKDRYVEDTGKGLAEIHEEKSEERAVQDNFYFFKSSAPNINLKRSFHYLFLGTADERKRNPRSSVVGSNSFEPE